MTVVPPDTRPVYQLAGVWSPVAISTSVPSHVRRRAVNSQTRRRATPGRKSIPLRRQPVSP